MVAVRKAIDDGIYNPNLYNFSFAFKFPQCYQALTIGYASQLIKNNSVNVIFGPPCPSTGGVVGALASYKKIPVFLWSTSGVELRNRLNEIC
jgi:hypothetical protein